MLSMPSMMRSFKERSLRKTREMLWVGYLKLSPGFQTIKMLMFQNMRTSRKNFKLSTTRSCRKLIKALHKEETVANSTVNTVSNKAMQDPALMRLIETFAKLFFLYFS
jgi:phage terminase large subunit-like protein